MLCFKSSVFLLARPLLSYLRHQILRFSQNFWRGWPVRGKMSYTRFLTLNPTKLRWRDLRSQLCFFLFLSGKEKGYFWKHWIVFSCTASFLGQLLPCYALVHERRPRFCHRDLLSLLAINKLYVFQWGQKTFLGVPKQKWRRVLIHKFFALSGLQNCNRKLSLIQIFFRAGIKTKYLLFA